jgi:hypothetical protein
LADEAFFVATGFFVEAFFLAAFLAMGFVNGGSSVAGETAPAKEIAICKSSAAGPQGENRTSRNACGNPQ